ncbi:MAG: NAD-dependent epimerase, partial [Bacillota bacterium]|nr:NAD-dependent epimerase [Bacillota bacterium]
MVDKLLNINKTYLITGVAGFIGFFLSKKLLEQGCKIICIDNLNDYYDVNLKNDRLNILETFNGFIFIKCDIADKMEVMDIFKNYKPNIVVNLAA